MKNVRRLLLDPALLPLSKQDLLKRIASESVALEMPCYLVGGFVRDLLLGKPVNDFDIVLNGDALKLGRALARKYGGKLTSHLRFKTATWFVGGGDALDLITARTEIYGHPGALPTIQPSTIEDDLRRRDFTINAMAVRLDGAHFGELLDPLDGQSDLARGSIRALHALSFMDDPTRMIRAVRYEKRYAFQIEASTLSLFDFSARAVLSKLSGERLRHEFDLVFGEDNVLEVMERTAQLGLLNPVHPALIWDAKIQNRFSLYLDSAADRQNLWGVWLMDLSADQIKSIGKRLHFTANTLKIALAASSIFHDVDSLVGLKPSQCVERLDDRPDEAIVVLANSIPYEKPRDVLNAYLSSWKGIKPCTTGDALKKRGMVPGPRYREILRRLRAAWVDGEVESEEQELRLLEILLAEKGAAR